MLTDQEVESVFGFNPAPGSPGVMWDLQHRVASRATTLTQAADGLDRVSADSWMGHGADSFHGTLHNLRRDVRTAAGAHTDYASALYAYVSEQESAKTQAQSLAQEALAARQAHTAALNANDHARAAAAQAELDGLVRRAQALQAHMDEVAGQAARRIDAAAERAPYAPPGWLEQAWDGLESAASATWHFVTSPEFLHGLSTVLSVVSAVCAFIPGLQGVALVAAALSIVTDVLAQVAAGQPVNWMMVGLSAAMVFIPGGRLARLFRDVPPELVVEAVEGGEEAKDIAVIGRQFDTEVAADWPGHEVFQIPQEDWSLAKNDQWVQSVIDRKMDVYVASNPTWENLWNAVRGEPRVFSRELDQFTGAGYTWGDGWTLLPPEP